MFQLEASERRARPVKGSYLDGYSAALCQQRRRNAFLVSVRMDDLHRLIGQKPGGLGKELGITERYIAELPAPAPAFAQFLRQASLLQYDTLEFEAGTNGEGFQQSRHLYLGASPNVPRNHVANGDGLPGTGVEAFSIVWSDPGRIGCIGCSCR